VKKMLLELSLAVAALCLFLSPAIASASPAPAVPAPSLSDQAFIASLAGTPAPELAAKKPSAKKPAFGVKSFCSANCWNGGTVDCSGSSCSAADGNCSWGEPGHVTCDGATTWCSSCPGCGPYWCNGEYSCAANCSNLGCDYDYTCSDYPSCSDNCRCTRCVY